ncbi:MAG TPA: hypothetical protein VNT55_17705 [Baekduia sp.]|nr:hypothetical protein [Baekduia sp.]
MRRTAIAAVVLTLAAPAAATAAKPRLDRSFGALHHGYWVRADGAWAKAYSATPVRGGAVLVASEDGRVTRIGAGGRADAGWGTGGAVDVSGPAAVVDGLPIRRTSLVTAAVWGDRILLSTARGATGNTRALVVDDRGRPLPVTDAVNTALPQAPVYGQDLLVPAPDGTLLDLRRIDSLGLPYTPPVPWSIRTLGPSGTVREGPHDVPDDVLERYATLGGAPVSPPTATGAPGLIVAPLGSWPRPTVVFRLLFWGGADRVFRPFPLPDSEYVSQMLPWHGGVIALTNRRVRWIDHTGYLVRSRRIVATRIARDAAQRLLVLAGSDDRRLVTVRRLRLNGRLDTGFGEVRLRAAGRKVEALGVVAARGGRLLVVGRTVEYHPIETREDVEYHARGTIAWRLLTR